MKTRKKLAVTALSTLLVGSLAAGTSILAFANSDTGGHEFKPKYDQYWYDFATSADAGATGSGVTATGTASTGEKPYLHVKYTAGNSVTPGDAIYKHGSPALNTLANGSSTITITMRAPEGDVTLDELMFAVRCPSYDNDTKVVAKSFAELRDSYNTGMTELTDEWQEYEISFSNTYEPTDKYDGGNGTAVTESNLAGIHIYAAEGAEGTLEINSVTYGDGEILTDFTGSADLTECAKIQNPDASWMWAGSAEGGIISRKVSVSDGGAVEIVKDRLGDTLGAYNGKLYAVIDAQSESFEGFKVYTTTDGSNWTEATDFDADTKSIAVTEDVIGFKFESTTETILNSIYLTNLFAGTPATAVPVIDASTADLIDDFSVAQSGINGDHEAMLAAPQMEKAGLVYRKSYVGGDAAKVENGALVLNGTGYTDFRFLSRTAHYGDYVIFKAKGDASALATFRFALINEKDGDSDTLWFKDGYKAGIDFVTPGFEEANPYKDGDWYYIVIDIKETGFPVYDTGYYGLNIMYDGGDLSIDSIFFADEVAKIDTLKFESDASLENDGDGTYVGYVYAPDPKLESSKLAFDITPAVDNFDASNLRLEFGGVGVFWGSVKDEGTLITTDGKKLNELTYVKDAATHVVIDLQASGITAGWEHMYVHANKSEMGGFKLENFKLYISTRASEFKTLDTENAYTVKADNGTDNKVIDFTPWQEGEGGYGTHYKYADYVGSLTDKVNDGYSVLAMDITIAEGTDLSTIRFGFDCGERWGGGEGHPGYLYLTDGTLLADAGFTAGVKKTVYIDLDKSDITLSDFHFHTSDDQTGAFKVENISLMKYVAAPSVTEAYATQLGLLNTYLDKTAPTVEITTATTATAGDEITIAYTAHDDVTADADLIVSVGVTKDGESITLTGNKFTAEEGVYHITVTVKDANGNQTVKESQITVSAAPVTPGTDTNTGDGNNLTWLWVVLGIVGVAVVGVGVYFLIKKLKAKKN